MKRERERDRARARVLVEVVVVLEKVVSVGEATGRCVREVMSGWGAG